MSSRRPVLLAVLAGSLLAAAVGGCQNKPDPAVDALPPVTDIDVEALRERYQKRNPDHRVGVVTAVLEASNLAAVGDIALQEFGIGDVVVFIDANEQPFNTGRVVNATSTALHVQYDPDQRAPRVGELAVRLAR